MSSSKNIILMVAWKNINLQHSLNLHRSRCIVLFWCGYGLSSLLFFSPSQNHHGICMKDIRNFTTFLGTLSFFLSFSHYRICCKASKYFYCNFFLDFRHTLTIKSELEQSYPGSPTLTRLRAIACEY